MPEICMLDTGPAGHAADCVARAGLDLSKSKSGRLFTCAGVPWPLTHRGRELRQLGRAWPPQSL